MGFDREARRLALQGELEALLGDYVARMDDGSLAILFQPPENVKLRYPCVIYEYDSDYFRHADDRGYLSRQRYDVLVIDRDPDTELPAMIVNHFAYCSHNSRYAADNLIHDSISLYY